MSKNVCFAASLGEYKGNVNHTKKLPCVIWNYSYIIKIVYSLLTTWTQIPAKWVAFCLSWRTYTLAYCLANSWLHQVVMQHYHGHFYTCVDHCSFPLPFPALQPEHTRKHNEYTIKHAHTHTYQCISTRQSHAYNLQHAQMVASELAAEGARESTIASHPQGTQATKGWLSVERHLQVQEASLFARSSTAWTQTALLSLVSFIQCLLNYLLTWQLTTRASRSLPHNWSCKCSRGSCWWLWRRTQSNDLIGAGACGSLHSCSVVLDQPFWKPT